MNPDLQQAIESGKITQQQAEILGQLAPGAFCQHKSWGFGKVAEWSLITGQILIDFKTKKGHPMQVQYAVETLQIIPAEHVLAAKFGDSKGLRERAEADPVGTLRSALSDHGNKLTAEQIATIFTPEAFDAASFKKWWESAKKKMKADGHFHLPGKKSEPIVLHDAPIATQANLLAKFRSARFLKEQVSALDQVVKSLDDFAHEVEELRSLALQVEDAASKGRKLQSAQALELLLARDEICSRHESLKPGEGATSAADILRAEESRLGTLFDSLPAVKQRRALQEFKRAFGDAWTDRALRLARDASARLVGEIHRLFVAEGRTEDFRDTLAKWISARSVSSETLIWLCKERGAGLDGIFNCGLLAAIFSALERDQLDEDKRGTRLQDLMTEDRKLLGDLLADAPKDAVRDAMRKLMLTTVFDDLSKRSLMARIIKLHPEIQSMVTGEAEDREETLTVSWASLDRRKKEYEDLISRQIPENLRDINIAKEEGDLRENFGFKAAKEQQRVLQRRAAEGERDLGLARGTNFENPDISQVSIGTIVELRDASGNTETYSILGAWDSIPAKGIVSYKAAIGQALLGRKVGDSLELPSESGARSLRIESISPFNNLELLGEIPES